MNLSADMREQRERRILEQARDFIVEEKPLHAIQLYRRLLHGTHYRREAHVELSALLRYLRLLKEAEKVLVQFLLANPEDSDIMYQIALLCYLQHKCQDAEQYVQRALLLDPNNYLLIDLLRQIQLSK